MQNLKLNHEFGIKEKLMAEENKDKAEKLEL
jgi:hypothetical protein